MMLQLGLIGLFVFECSKQRRNLCLSEYSKEIKCYLSEPTLNHGVQIYITANLMSSLLHAIYLEIDTFRK